MGHPKIFPPTTSFPIEISQIERDELETHYLNLRDNYKKLKISRGLLLSHAGSKALLLERNQLLAKAKRDLEIQIEEIENSEAGKSQLNYQILQQVVEVFEKMEDLGNELSIGYEDYEKGRRNFAGGAPLRTLIRSVINFFNSWSLIKDQIEAIKYQIKTFASKEKSVNKQLK